MIRTILIMGLFLLIGCTSYPQCVDVLYMQTNEKECYTNGYWYQGRMIKPTFPNLHAGFVIDTKYLGEAGVGFDKSLLCKEKPNLKWKFYQVFIADGNGGSWYLNGEGYKNYIAIWPNKMYMKSREGHCY